MSSSPIPTQSRRTQFSACMALSPRCSATLEYTQRHPLLPLPHLRMQTHSPHSKPVLLPLSSSSHCSCSSATYFGCWCYCGWAVYRRRRRQWNILEHHTTQYMLMPILPSFFLPVPYDTCPSGGKNHMHNSPVSFAHGPVIQRPDSRRRPFNMSTGPSHWSIVVVVESKAALVALLPLTPQISCLIDSLPSSIIVESFCLSYGDLCLSITSVPNPSDLSRVETFVHTLVSEDSQCDARLHSRAYSVNLLVYHSYMVATPSTPRMPPSFSPLLSTRTAFILLPQPGLFMILDRLIHAQSTSISGTYR